MVYYADLYFKIVPLCYDKLYKKYHNKILCCEIKTNLICPVKSSILTGCHRTSSASFFRRAQKLWWGGLNEFDAVPSPFQQTQTSPCSEHTPFVLWTRNVTMHEGRQVLPFSFFFFFLFVGDPKFWGSRKECSYLVRLRDSVTWVKCQIRSLPQRCKKKKKKEKKKKGGTPNHIGRVKACVKMKPHAIHKRPLLNNFIGSN